MKKILMVIAGIIVSCGVMTALLPNVAFADTCEPDDFGYEFAVVKTGEEVERIETNLLGMVCDDGHGSAMKATLNLILKVLTYGVGVGGVVGIVISGIQYLTARDNEAQAAKARRRILEVVIGLIVYAVMYVVLEFLLIPSGVPTS